MSKGKSLQVICWLCFAFSAITATVLSTITVIPKSSAETMVKVGFPLFSALAIIFLVLGVVGILRRD